MKEGIPNKERDPKDDKLPSEHDELRESEREREREGGGGGKRKERAEAEAFENALTSQTQATSSRYPSVRKPAIVATFREWMSFLTWYIAKRPNAGTAAENPINIIPAAIIMY